MKSKTYVNEIDISKVRTGQPVTIGVDAFPTKKYTGMVTEVANIGQQLPNSNAKVFEVIIEVNEFDSILRPAMTTKNEILTASIENVLYIPIECVQSNDSLSYVYVPNGRKQVITGASSENEIVILAGLEKNDQVFLVAPSDAEDYSLEELDQEVVRKFSEELTEKEGQGSRGLMQTGPPPGGSNHEDFQKMRKSGTPPMRRNQSPPGKK